MEPGQKIAKYSFNGAAGISVDFTVTSQPGQETTVIDVKAEVCAEPPGKVNIIWTSMRETSFCCIQTTKAQPSLCIWEFWSVPLLLAVGESIKVKLAPCKISVLLLVTVAGQTGFIVPDNFLEF